MVFEKVVVSRLLKVADTEMTSRCYIEMCTIEGNYQALPIVVAEPRTQGGICRVSPKFACDRAYKLVDPPHT